MSEIPLELVPDQTLVVRALDGDVSAFTTLLKRYRRLMYGYAQQLTSERSDADDAVQEAFITAWRSLDTLKDPSKVKPWLMRIVGHSAIDIMRRRKAHSDIDLEEDSSYLAEPGPDITSEVNLQLAAAGEILDQLPLVQRQTWVMREVGGYSYQEIADELELPVSTVRGLLARARSSLIKGMEGWK